MEVMALDSEPGVVVTTVRPEGHTTEGAKDKTTSAESIERAVNGDKVDSLVSDKVVGAGDVVSSTGFNLKETGLKLRDVASSNIVILVNTSLQSRSHTIVRVMSPSKPNGTARDLGVVRAGSSDNRGV
ncbi:hypothetical protein V6N12_031187 [Hibiscus sabdariffa]|uniref:Uncharacterized protein n=1 Tax=Hibiscus sabdariffa TaxID=183260 RepID=A0ABR2E898_9ROSI